MIEVPDWKRRANLLSYFWTRIDEEGWYKSDDPDIQWAITKDSPKAIPAMSWFDEEEE